MGGNSHDHLLAAEERVADELARAQGDLAFRHDCDVDEVNGKVVGAASYLDCRCAASSTEFRLVEMHGPVWASRGLSGLA